MQSIKTGIMQVEARRNPGDNSRVSVEEHIENHLSQSGELSGTSQKNSFVSLTKVDKLGINPGSSDNHTPLGIYAYPSEYVMHRLNGRKITALPHAGFQPYTNIFSVQGNIVDLGTMTGGDLQKYKNVLKKMYVSIADGDPDAEDFLEDEVLDAASTEAPISTPGGQLWWIAGKTASVLIEHPDIGAKMYDAWPSTEYSKSYNSVFRKIGIDGCVDSKGQGIIYYAEPTQAVFFAGNTITDLERHTNPQRKKTQ